MESGSLCEPLPIIKTDLGAGVAHLMSHFGGLRTHFQKKWLM